VAAELRETVDAVTELRERQLRAAEDADAVALSRGDERRKVLDRIAGQQREMAETAGELARRVKRLAHAASADQLGEAAGHMQSAARSAAANDAASTAQSAREAVRALDDIRDRLDRGALAARRRQAAMETRFLLHQLQSIRDGQERIVTGTSELVPQRQEDGQLTAAAAQTASELAGQQRALAGTTRDLIRAIESTAFRYGLERVESGMDRAAQRLADRAVDAPTIRLQQEALAHLQQMLDAAAQSQDGSPNDTAGGDDRDLVPDQDAPPNDSRESSGFLLAELQLLHAWQIELNRRTEELAGGQLPIGRSGEPRAEARIELAAEQLRLAEIVERLLSPEGKKGPAVPPARADDGLDQLDELLRKGRGRGAGP
jgi:hypothetical protein